MPNNPKLSAWLNAQHAQAIRSESLESLTQTEAPTCHDLARALAAHARHTLRQHAEGDGAFQGFIAAAVGVTQ